MPPTLRGVYHNLKESKYVVSNEDITFFFSSEHTLNKFMNGYENKRKFFTEKWLVIGQDTPLNMDTMSDIQWYKNCEKRGFYVWLKGVSITWEELNQYALRRMTEKNSPEWVRTERPRTVERFR